MGSHSYLPPTHEPYLPLLPSRKALTALWLVLVVPTHKGMARLSRPGWLVTYRDKCSAPVGHNQKVSWSSCLLVWGCMSRTHSRTFGNFQVSFKGIISRPKFVTHSDTYLKEFQDFQERGGNLLFSHWTLLLRYAALKCCKNELNSNNT